MTEIFKYLMGEEVLKKWKIANIGSVMCKCQQMGFQLEEEDISILLFVDDQEEDNGGNNFLVVNRRNRMKFEHT